MLVISDVHLALDALRRVIAEGQTLLILGDLVNLSDYRTGEGAVADVLGIDFARIAGTARGGGNYGAMRQLWSETVGDRASEVRQAIGEAIAAQYVLVAEALEGAKGYAIHGNVDRPELLKSSLPAGLEYVHGARREIGGLVFGFVGGGMQTPLDAAGEVSDDEMSRMLAGIGPVDVLCSHVPPAITALRTDVITGRAERGSQPLLDYVLEHRPKLHLFGDVHQPKASRWRIGPTECHNVGYFRATGRAFELDPRLYK